MFLKRVFNLKVLKLLAIFTFLSFSSKGSEDVLLKDVIEYLKNLGEFSSSFLQIQENDVSEGLIFIKNNRLRIEYLSPFNLIFVLKKDKGMYFNAELEEVQYFNPKKTIGGLLVDLFNNDNFLKDSITIKKESYFYIRKKIQLDEVEYIVKIYFEEKPLQLKKLEIVNDLEIITITILNHNYNPNLNNKIFSLANPLLS